MSSTVYSEIKEIKKYHNNGELKEHYFTKNNRLHGEYKCLNDDGGLREHCFFKDGECHGECKWYYNNGALRERCIYKDGNLHGEYKSYRKNGVLDNHYFYNNGSEEEISEYIEDPNNITDSEFMNLSMVFGDNFFASESFTGTAS